MSQVDPELVEKVRATVHNLGLVGASQMLLCSRESLMRVMSGQPVRPGTVALMQLRFKELDDGTGK